MTRIEGQDAYGKRGFIVGLGLVVLIIVGAVVAWNHDADVRIENERTGEIIYALGGRVKMIRLSDGTRCVVYERSLGAAIDCDWDGGEE